MPWMHTQGVLPELDPALVAFNLAHYKEEVYSGGEAEVHIVRWHYPAVGAPGAGNSHAELNGGGSVSNTFLLNGGGSALGWHKSRWEGSGSSGSGGGAGSTQRRYTQPPISSGTRMAIKLYRRLDYTAGNGTFLPIRHEDDWRD